MVPRVVLILRTAAIVCIASGMIGGMVWLLDLADRSDGDDLRWGFWHNPFMRFAPFNEPFLDVSMWVLLGCSAAIWFGGLMLLVPNRWGALLVTWQALVSITINGIVVSVITFTTVTGAGMEWCVEAVALRLGSILVNLTLLFLLTRKTTRSFFTKQVLETAASPAKWVMARRDNPYAPPMPADTENDHSLDTYR